MGNFISTPFPNYFQWKKFLRIEWIYIDNNIIKHKNPNMTQKIKKNSSGDPKNVRILEKGQNITD